MNNNSIFWTLKSMRPGAEFSINGDNIDDIIWLDDSTPPTKEEIEVVWEEIKEEVFLKPVREERNRLLMQSDWTQIADAPVDAVAWAEYRQALRDLPANTTDPENPVWPTPPE